MSEQKCADCWAVVVRQADGSYGKCERGRKHIDCLECGQKVVCHIKGICAKCDFPYHFVTDQVAVGSCSTPYEPFEVIFNLNYPENEARHHDHKVRFQDGRCIVHFGLIDSEEDAEYMKKVVRLMNELIPSIKSKKVLFHCFAGYSRSVTLAAAYLCLSGKCQTVEEGVEMVRSSRKYVGPNAALIEATREVVANIRQSNIL